MHKFPLTDPLFYGDYDNTPGDSFNQLNHIKVDKSPNVVHNSHPNHAPLDVVPKEINSNYQSSPYHESHQSPAKINLNHPNHIKTDILPNIIHPSSTKYNSSWNETPNQTYPNHIVLDRSRHEIPINTSKEAQFKRTPSLVSAQTSNSAKLDRKSSDFFQKNQRHASVRDDPRNHDRQPKQHVSSSRRCANCCKKTFAFLVSHIGLCSMVVAYSIAGGFIFKELEAPFEVKERSSVAAKRKLHVEKLWNMTEELNILFKENWTEQAEKVLSDFQMEVYRATKEKGWDGKDGDTDLQWSFSGALLYSVTVITTIGYGHIAPKTANGRLVTIFYALLGIPLTLLCLANIGRMFSDCFRFTYKYTIRCLKWTFLPSRPVYKMKAQRRRHSNIRKQAKERMLHINEDVERGRDQAFCIEDNDDDEDPEEPVRVPVCVSMGVMSLYIFGGAVLFTLWEDDWDYLIGSYFCFITLSTIGFGDFVPGANLDSWANQEKTILCTLYLVFGLSLIAMCFNLMQEEVKLKVTWLATKLNIIDGSKKRKG